MSETKTLLRKLWLEGGGNPDIKEPSEQNVLDLMHGLHTLVGELAEEEAKTLPLFAVPIAQSKWDSLQTEGYKMQRIIFSRIKDNQRHTGHIDPWGLVTWQRPSASSWDVQDGILTYKLTMRNPDGDCLCATCGVAQIKHGSYPTCSDHPFREAL